MFKRIALLTLAVFSLTASAAPNDGVIDIFASIPFVRGADACKFSNSYGQTRTQNLNQMVSLAERLLQSGMKSSDVVPALITFNNLYDRNQGLAQMNLDVTLESSLKAYFDDYYRDLTPKRKKVSFTHLDDLKAQPLSKLDYIAYGTYTLAPSCKGNISVTLHLIKKSGRSESYSAIGNVDTVMSQIAAKMFTEYQRTKFPNSLRIGNKMLTIVGGLNGSVDQVSDPTLAEEACAMLDARLPTRLEMELIDSYGDWSGGISLGTAVWAYPGGKVYAAELRNPTPIRNTWEVNDHSFKYYCVK